MISMHAKALDCSGFQLLLQSSSPAYLEQALQTLQNREPDFLKRTVYVYDSLMTVDGASTDYPRALMYGEDAKVVLGFNGHPRQKAFERLELMCFNDTEKKFEFTDIVFPKEAANSEALNDLLPEERLKNFVMIPGGRGVRECRRCHEEVARPNWDTFPLWPGVYGGANDGLKDRTKADERPIYSAFEDGRWKRFQTKPAKEGRYRFTSQSLQRPNSDFTLKLSQLNGLRIVGDLKRLGAKFEAKRFDFARALFCAPKAERMEFRLHDPADPAPTQLAVVSAAADSETKDMFLEAYFDRMARERRFLSVLKVFGLVQPFPKEKYEDLRHYYRGLYRDENLDMKLSSVDVDEVLLVRELKKVTDKLDVDIENWSMALNGGFGHENGDSGVKPALKAILAVPFMAEFLKDDTEAKAAFAKSDDTALCDVLRRRP